MVTLRKKRKLAADTRETQEEHPRNGQSRNTSVSRNNEEFIIQVSEEIEGRVTKILSQEFRRTQSRILGAPSKLDEFNLNPQIRPHYGTVPGTFRKTNVKNHGTNEDDSQSDPHPEAGFFRSQITQKSGPEIGHDIVTGVIEETYNGQDMVTGVQEEIRYRPHMVTEIQEDFPYCTFGTSSGNQKKACSTSQPLFRIENTPATIEADPILLVFPPLASNSNSANINNNINKITKLPKSLTTTMPTFDAIYSKRV